MAVRRVVPAIWHRRIVLCWGVEVGAAVGAPTGAIKLPAPCLAVPLRRPRPVTCLPRAL